MRHPYRPVVRLKTETLWKRLDALGFTLQTLAQEIGMNHDYLARLMKTGKAPSGRIRRRMQDVLGVDDWDDLFIQERPE